MIGLDTNNDLNVATWVAKEFERHKRMRIELEAAMMRETKHALIQMLVGIMGDREYPKDRIIDAILEDYSAKQIEGLWKSYTQMEISR